METTTPAPAALECPSIFLGWPFITAGSLFIVAVGIIITLGVMFSNEIKDRAKQMMARRVVPISPADDQSPPREWRRSGSSVRHSLLDNVRFNVRDDGL